MAYNPSHLGCLLRQWGAGNLNNIVDHGHVVAGVNDVVVTGAGFMSVGLSQRFTSEEVDQVFLQMLCSDDCRAFAILLLCRHLKGWSVERLARAMGHPSVSMAQTHLMVAEDHFAEQLLNAH